MFTRVSLSFLFARRNISRCTRLAAVPMIVTVGLAASASQAQTATYISSAINDGSFETQVTTGFLSIPTGKTWTHTSSSRVLANVLPDTSLTAAGTDILKFITTAIGSATGDTNPLDNVSVTGTPAPPETAALLLFVFGMMGLLAVRQSQKRDAQRRTRAAVNERRIAARSRWLNEFYGSGRNEVNGRESKSRVLQEKKVCRANLRSIATSDAPS